MTRIDLIIKKDKELRESILSANQNCYFRSNGDDHLKKSLIKWQDRLLYGSCVTKDRKEETLIKYRYIYDNEWHVVQGMTQYGVGDLVFTDGRGNFLVMERHFQ